MSREREIREKLKAEIEAVLPANSAKVFEYWALGIDFNDWPGMLRLPSGNVHGYVIHWMGGAPRGSWAFRITALHSHKGKGSVDAFGEALDLIFFRLRPGLLVLPSYPEGVEHAGLTWQIDVSEIRNELTQWAFGDITFQFSC